MGTDKDWEAWGANDPYYGVASDERFRAEAMTPAARRDFFASGTAHVDDVLKGAHAFFGADFKPRSCLDFGCGVGRLLIPFAQLVEHVTGVDVSPSMRAEAQRNCAAAGVSNVTVVASDDALSRIEGHFDLVHSWIVFQHIPWHRGRVLLQSLANHIAPGGGLVVQMLTASHAPAWMRGLVRLRYACPPVNWVRNMVRGRPLFEPAMQLHIYDLDAVLADLAKRGFDYHCAEEPYPEFRSTVIYAKRHASS